VLLRTAETGPAVALGCHGIHVDAGLRAEKNYSIRLGGKVLISHGGGTLTCLDEPRSGHAVRGTYSILLYLETTEVHT
jgi:hypothetical protein